MSPRKDFAIFGEPGFLLVISILVIGIVADGLAMKYFAG
jgi:hypothetical protein